MGAAVLLAGRAFFAAAFIVAGVEHLADPGRTLKTVSRAGVPLPRIMGPLAFVLALVGGLSILLGFEARWGALLLIVFLVPSTLATHCFWRAAHGREGRRELQQFLKNAALVGSALAWVYFGSGPLSLGGPN
jgi:putative oxidoreductase